MLHVCVSLLYHQLMKGRDFKENKDSYVTILTIVFMTPTHKVGTLRRIRRLYLSLFYLTDLVR